MTEWMDCTQTWPTHQKREVQDELLFARKRGWHFAKRSEHFGWVVCRRTDEEAHCHFSIHSTPQTPRNHAKDLRRTILRCPHGPDPDEGVAGGQAAGFIQSARNLLIAAGNWIEGQQSLAFAYELFNLAVIASKEAERHHLLERSIQTETRAVSVTHLAIASIREEGLLVGASLAIPEVLSEADSRLDQAELVVEGSEVVVRGTIGEEIDALRGEIHRLEIRLEALG